MSEQKAKPEERREDPGDLVKVKELLRFLEKSRPGDVTNQMSDLIEAVCVGCEMVEGGDAAEYYDAVPTSLFGVKFEPKSVN